MVTQAGARKLWRGQSAHFWPAFVIITHHHSSSSPITQRGIKHAIPSRTSSSSSTISIPPLDCRNQPNTMPTPGPAAGRGWGGRRKKKVKYVRFCGPRLCPASPPSPSTDVHAGTLSFSFSLPLGFPIAKLHSWRALSFGFPPFPAYRA